MMKSLKEKAGKTIVMSESRVLARMVREYVGDTNVTHVVESGTFRGTGSTRMLASSFKDTAQPSRFITIEVNYVSWRAAVGNLIQTPFVRAVWGRTVSLQEALRHIRTDEAISSHMMYDDVYIDDIHQPMQFYENELRGALGGMPKAPYDRARWVYDRLFHYQGDDLLQKYLCKYADCEPLVLLDSSGGIGLLEYTIMRKTLQGKRYSIILDDIDHLKHFRSFNEISQDPHYAVHGVNADEGWVFASHNP